ncbi:cupin domain-containing protein [Kitasatospora paranensis]|uniref:Cupin domain-containing protein n=1 Tax=Kitasatospora paranensis TaxID=258053 RepID=A0ABW2FTF8_9ACTN
MSLRDLGFSVDEFSGGWPDRAVTTTAHEAVRAVLSPDDVDELVTHRGLRMPAFRMARDGKLVNPRHYTLASGSDTASTVGQLADAEGIARQVGRGSTLVLQGLQRFHPPAGRLARALAGDLGARVFANAYLTPDSAQGFAEHTDPYSAFLVQLAGAKRWLVRPSADAPAQEVVLRPLDVLWLPAGWLHAGVALPGSPSVHLTLAVNPLPLTDVVTAITESLMRQVDGETLPPLPADNAQHVLEREVDQLAARLRAALEGVDTKELARTLLARSVEGTAAPSDRVSTVLGFAPPDAPTGTGTPGDGGSRPGEPGPAAR